MRFALINNEKVEAATGLKGGVCPGCFQPVVAKCGTQKIHHWAHQSKKTCDSWWEAETEWHRSWKSQFPTDWQEVFLPNEQTGEKHVADVRTSHGLVIEFQHSHIDPQERYSREKFYKNMVWVVDGTRLKRDYPRFLMGKDDLKRIGDSDFFSTSFPEECFPSAWIESSVPVVFDFHGDIFKTDTEGSIRNILWCLLPGRAKGRATGIGIRKEVFLVQVTNHPELLNVHELMEVFTEYFQRMELQQTVSYRKRSVRKSKRL